MNTLANRTWGAYTVGAVAAFGYLEWRGITRRAHGPTHGTLSASLRRWMGIEPLADRRWFWRIVFTGILGWFATHILTGLV